MQDGLIRKYPTIACCGIDCGLCPRYYTSGDSRCPGCGAAGFAQKHPSCPILTCCLKVKGIEACAECHEFPCRRMESWDKADSFVTHRKSLMNLEQIRQHGSASFIRAQQARIRLLEELISQYDDGRSKSFYCLSAALLPPAKIKSAIARIKRDSSIDHSDTKEVARRMRRAFEKIADEERIELTYRRGA